VTSYDGQTRGKSYGGQTRGNMSKRIMEV